jgi:Tfp pilus assembly protein PilV
MIEVLLALTVIAIGMTSVLGLFPVGLNASRNAVAQNMSADVADQMITYMRVMSESSQDAYDYTFDLDNNVTTDLPVYSNTDLSSGEYLNITTTGDTTTINLDSTTTNLQTLSDNFLKAYKDNNVSTSGTEFQRVAPGWSIFYPKPATNQRRRVYFIVQGPNCTEDSENRTIDYSAMALVWKSPAQIKRLESDGTTWSYWPANADIQDPTKAYSVSGKINIELSWPLELPYKERKKRYYQIIISKPAS